MYSRVRHCGPDIRFDQVATADSDCLAWCSHAGGPHSPLGEQLRPVIVDSEVSGAGCEDEVSSWVIGGLDG